MLTFRGCVHSARRLLHSKCPPRSRPARDPAYLGLFESQEQDPPWPPELEALDDDALVKRIHLRNAFYHKIRDWARTTPPEYISRPFSRPRSRYVAKPTASDGGKWVKGKEFPKPVLDNAEQSSELDDDDNDSELDVVDDEEELRKLDGDDGEANDKADFEADQQKHKLTDSSRQDYTEDGKPVAVDNTVDDKARRKSPPLDLLNDDELYFFNENGKLKRKPIHILAPKQEIYQRLSQSGLISSKFKRPLPVQKLVKKSDAEIVRWYHYCGIDLLYYFRICHNLKEVKAIVEYHIRWSAIQTLAKKNKCNPREIIKKYGRDLECEDKKGRTVRLLTRQELKSLGRGVSKGVEPNHKFRALNMLDEME